MSCRVSLGLADEKDPSMRLRYTLACLAAVLIPSTASAQVAVNSQRPWVDQTALALGAPGQLAQPVTTTNPLPTSSKAPTSFATNQVVVGTTATLVVAARAGRQRVAFTIGAANTCAFGNAGVTLANGFPLQPVAGAAITIDAQSQIYAVCSASTTIGFIDFF